MKGIIDIHAHILPGVDDGASDWEEARQMLQCTYAQGIRTVIATPHYSHRQDVLRLRKLAGQLDEEAKAIAPDFDIYLGQEILYFDSMVERLKEGHALTMAGSRHVLVEFMPEVPYKKLYQAVRNVLLSGYYPVIAHVERYRALRDEGQMEELEETGCLMQMNYRSLQGGLFDQDARWCKRQVLDGRIQFLGTDMHHEDHRTPEIEKSLRWLNGHVEERLLGSLVRGNAEKILKTGILAGDKEKHE